MGIKAKVVGVVPWVEPILDYFDWRKRLIALAAGAALAGWSFVKDLPWPVIVALGAAAIVIVAYALVFPAFIKLINIGAKPRPNHSIWKHKKQFALYQAACLLADCEPARDPAMLGGDAAAWYEGLCEAIRTKEIKYMSTMYDPQHTYQDGYHPYIETPIEATELKKYCEARGRYPEFLR